MNYRLNISTNELYEEDDLKDDLPDEGPGVLLRPDLMNKRGNQTRVTHKDWDFWVPRRLYGINNVFFALKFFFP